jgi:transposase
MVAAVRAGESQRAVARCFAVRLATVQYWVRHAGERSLEAVDWSDQRRGPRQPINRTPLEIEEQVVQLRSTLAASDLGEHGAQAIYRELLAQQVQPLPCARTIARILERRGLVETPRRVRRPAPPRGWYLPLVATGLAELEAWDVVEGLKLQGGPLVEVLNTISLHGGLAGSWPCAGSVTAARVRECLVQHWRQWGCPRYVQFDNDTIFQGPHQHADVVSSVMRTCLSLGVTPVFAPPRESGFQAAIESYNGLWQAKVWARYTHPSESALREQSQRYVTAHRQRTAARQAEAPARRSFPQAWTLDLQAPPQGQLVFLRRTNQQGEATLLGRTFLVDRAWAGRLVRCDVKLQEHVMRFYQLRRRAPREQPLLREVSYQLPLRPFRE